MPSLAVERDHHFQSIKRLVQRFVDARHPLHHVMTGTLQQHSVAMKDDGQQRDADHRQRRELPVHIERHGDTGEGLERLAHDLPAEQTQTVPGDSQIVREPGHQLRFAVPHQRLVVQFQCVSKAIFAQRHHRQLDDASDQNLLNEKSGPLDGGPDQQDAQNHGVSLERIVRNPRHDPPLNPAKCDQLLGRGTELAASTILTLQDFLVRRRGLPDLCGSKLASLDLSRQVIQFPFAFVDFGFAVDDFQLNVLLKTLIFEQNLDDQKRQR